MVFKPNELPKFRMKGLGARVSQDATMFAAFTGEDADPPVGIRLYHWPDLKLERALSGGLSEGLAFAPHLNRVFEGEHLGRLSMWDINTGRRTRLIHDAEPVNVMFGSLDVSPDGTMLLVGASYYLRGSDGAVMLQLWRTDPPELIDHWPDVKQVYFTAFLNDSAFVLLTADPYNQVVVRERDPQTLRWTKHHRLGRWPMGHVALDRAREVLYGTSGSSAHVACLDLSARGQCPSAD